MTTVVSRLRAVLRANAVFSFSCALAGLVGSKALAVGLGIPAPELRGLGVQLLVFAGFLVFLSSRPALGQGWTYWAVLVLGVIDLLWVVGTAQALGSGALTPTTLGVGLIVGIALVVGAFGCLELWLWSALYRSRRLGNALETTASGRD